MFELPKGWIVVGGSVYDSEQSADFSDMNVKFHTESNGVGSLEFRKIIRQYNRNNQQKRVAARRSVGK